MESIGSDGVIACTDLMILLRQLHCLMILHRGKPRICTFIDGFGPAHSIFFGSGQPKHQTDQFDSFTEMRLTGIIPVISGVAGRRQPKAQGEGKGD